MEMMDIIRSRHSVRQYLDKPVPQEIRRQLDECAAALNREGDLRIQILYDEPGCFSSRMAHYGKCEHADNYISLVGKRSEGLEERCGFYGEKLVLKAQELGLNTCWVALTHGKSKVVVGADEKEVIIISLDYGKTQGVAQRTNPPPTSATSPQTPLCGSRTALRQPCLLRLLSTSRSFALSGMGTL